MGAGAFARLAKRSEARSSPAALQKRISPPDNLSIITREKTLRYPTAARSSTFFVVIVSLVAGNFGGGQFSV